MLHAIAHTKPISTAAAHTIDTTSGQVRCPFIVRPFPFVNFSLARSLESAYSSLVKGVMQEENMSPKNGMRPTSLKLVAPPKPPLVLQKIHIHILQQLRDLGFERASQFDEDAVDELFKARPRLVALVKGYVQATIDITTEGLEALAKATRS
jgi:hypothetical protein